MISKSIYFSLSTKWCRLVELPAYILGMFAMDYLGRRLVLNFTLLGGGIFCLVAGLVSKGKKKLNFLGKLLIGILNFIGFLKFHYRIQHYDCCIFPHGQILYLHVIRGKQCFYFRALPDRFARNSHRNLLNMRETRSDYCAFHIWIGMFDFLF